MLWVWVVPNQTILNHTFACFLLPDAQTLLSHNSQVRRAAANPVLILSSFKIVLFISNVATLSLVIAFVGFYHFKHVRCKCNIVIWAVQKFSAKKYHRHFCCLQCRLNWILWIKSVLVQASTVISRRRRMLKLRSPLRSKCGKKLLLFSVTFLLLLLLLLLFPFTNNFIEEEVLWAEIRYVSLFHKNKMI